MTRKFIYHHEGVHYYRFSVYRLNQNVQTVYAYLVDDVLIDTAQRHNRENIIQVLKDKHLSKIILTHHHEDHSGNVAYLMRKFNVEGYAHSYAVKLLKKGYITSPLANIINGSVDRAELNTIQDGDTIITSHHQLQAIYTPGHSNDHLCFYEANKGWLFSGDLYVADKIKYFAKFESLLTQIESLKKLVALEFDALFCAHNPKIKNGKTHLKNKLQFFEDFAGNVTQYYNKGYTAKQIFDQLQLKENYINKYITFGNFCAENMVHSVIKDIKLQ